MQQQKIKRNISVQDLTYLYAYRNFDIEPSIVVIRSMCVEMCTLLSKGWCSKDIMQGISRSKPHTPIANLMDGRVQANANIINPYRFYYHNQLRIVPDVIIDEKTVDEETELIDTSEKYYLEMKASYTVDDIVEYYISAIGVDRKILKMEEQKRIFNWLLKRYDLDLLMYMTDSFVANVIDNDKEAPLVPLEIQKFSNEARTILLAKRTEAKESDNDRIIPRKRVLSYGSWGKDSGEPI